MPPFKELNRRFWTALGITLGLGLGAAAPVAAPVTLQLKWHHQFQFAGYYAAQEQGYYREAGLDVRILEAEPGIDVVQRVTQGEAQYGVGNSALILDRNQGRPVVVLGVVFQHSPVILLARSGAGIATVQDLEGKRVMLEDRTDELRAYLRKEDVPERSLRIVKHTFDPEDLILGKVDCISAYSTDEPYFLKQAHQDVIELSPRMGGIDFYGDNLFTSEAELRDHPARAKAFLDASMKGWKYAMAHQAEVVDLIIGLYGERRGRGYLRYEAQRMVPLLQPGTVEMGYMYRGRWQHIADTYAELGLVRPGFKLDGFLYDPEAGVRKDTQRLVIIIAVLVVLGGLLGGAALVFLRLNLRLKKEIATRVRAVEERAKLEAQLLQAQKMRSLGDLAGGVAHDMNNVLGAILGFAESNLDDLPPDSRAYRAFDTIARAATRGGKMVRSLLSFARQSPAEERELDLNAVLCDEVQILAHTTLTKVELVMDLDPDLRPMRGDPNVLANAIMNLCVNAVDAMPDRGVLTLRTRNLGPDALEVQVVDTGCGMPPEVLARALDPFFTTKPEGRGTGLGLSMVFGVVEAHRGTLDLQSRPGAGTTVTLRFPACEPATPPAAAAGAASAGSASALRVLVVDDDDLFQSSVQGLLERLGHAVTPALSGEEAIRQVEAGLRPDVVMLDMNMPGLGGAGTLPRLRALLPAVPFVVTTGRADQAAMAFVKGHANVTLMPKPFTLQELSQRLGSLAGVQ